MTERPKRKGIMLAQPVSNKRVRALGNSMFAQPKLKGERCRVEWFHKEPVLISSYGNEFKFLNHIKEAIKEHFQFSLLPLDGELYKHGWNFERIHSAASRKVNESSDTAGLEFHVFDYQGSESQWERIHVLNKKVGLYLFESPLVYVPYTIVTPDNWLEQANIYTSEGYEGIILRGPIWSYETKRSQGLLKFKPTEEDEYEIIDVTEAISKEGNPKGMVGSFRVCGDDNTLFYVGAGKLDHAERIRLWNNRGSIKGLNLKTKHEKTKTVGGVPDCCVAVEVIE